MNKSYFEKPTQVKFVEPWQDKVVWLAGIAYRDEVICGCCGGVFEIDEIVESAKDFQIEDPIEAYDFWVDISDEIIGDEVDTFTYHEDDPCESK